MTSLRRGRKRRRIAGCGVLLLACLLKPELPLRAATTEFVVVNRHTGLALSGFDPVAYFVDGAARLGRAEFEMSSAGAVWRFVNEGNLAAFAAAPETYTPQFGGYDPVAIARGASTPGHPLMFLLARGQLYLFYNAEARDAFAADPDNLRRAAEENWATVQRQLAP
jgi:hypothetical protein